MTVIRSAALLDDQGLLEWLTRDDPPAKRAVIGFDGYVDTLYRVVKNRSAENASPYFQRISEFGQRILDASERSADIEIRMQCRQMGGNAPLMADGMAALDDNVTLLGALGCPQIHPCFEKLCTRMEAVSLAEPSQTIALEFDDGKIMMGDTENSKAITWDAVQKIFSDHELAKQLEQAGLVAVLNWSAHADARRIARQLAKSMRAFSVSDHETRKLFIDLSDPSSLSAAQLSGLLNDIAQIAMLVPTVLGMNENEARHVFASLFPDMNPHADILSLSDVFGCETARRLGLDTLTIHATSQALGFTAHTSCLAEGIRIQKPSILTGGGDHYNAGFCHGMLHELPLSQCLLLGSAAASFYVQNAFSANQNDLAQFIRERKGNTK